MIFFNKPKIFHVKGLSLNELKKKYGTMADHLRYQGFRGEDWWQDLPFAKESSEPEDYLVDFKGKQKNYDNGFTLASPAVIASILLDHFHRTEKRLMKNWFTYTNLVINYKGSDQRVLIGNFGMFGIELRLEKEEDTCGWCRSELEDAVDIYPVLVKKI